MSFTGKLLQSSKDPIYLVSGNDHIGLPAWYYLMVTRTKLQLYKKAMATGNLHLTDYGIILKSGYGNGPPADIAEHMKKEHNF